MIRFLPLIKKFLYPLRWIGFITQLEYEVHWLDHQGDWILWTNGMPSREAAQESAAESKSRHSGTYRVCGVISFDVYEAVK